MDINLKKLAKFTMEEYTDQYGKYAILVLSSKFSEANTVAHADMWTNNLLIETKKDGTMTDKITSIIDWQIACVG